MCDRGRDHMNTVVITSPASDVGKTMLAAGLSEAAAASGCRTLLVDLDNPEGELLRIIGREASYEYPSVNSWAGREWCEYARSPYGAYVLPNNTHKIALEQFVFNELFRAAASFFDVLIIDLGINPGAASWKHIIENADTTILVTDCDSKAMFRVSEFLKDNYVRPTGKWLLAINHREGKHSFYTPRQMARTLGSHEDVSAMVQVPFIDKIGKRRPHYFAPDDPIAHQLLEQIWARRKESKTSENNEDNDRAVSIDTDEMEKASRLQDSSARMVPAVSMIHPVNFDNRQLNVPANSNCRPAIIGLEPDCSETVGEIPQDRKRWPFSLASFSVSFSGRKLGVIISGRFIKEKFTDPVAMLDKYGSEKLDAIVIPASIGFDVVKKYRRDGRSQAVLLVVINGNQQHIALGADRVSNRVSSELIQSIGAYAVRLRELWSSVELDFLTRCIKREFFEAWLRQQEEQERCFSIVFIDPDRFKNINDTFGHDAGDAVLVQFGNFLRNNSRCADLVCRWGGDEFVVAMPDTSARQAYALIDRLREKWADKNLHLPGGTVISNTFSAGVAEYYHGCDVVKLADKMMYHAKQNGRNQVHAEFSQRLYVLGDISVEALKQNGFTITRSSAAADYIISDTEHINEAPVGRTVYVLGNGGIGDWCMRRNYPDILLFSSLEQLIGALENATNPSSLALTNSDSVECPQSNSRPELLDRAGRGRLAVLPGARSSSANQTIPAHGAIFVVCPSRPGLAGEIAAALANSISKGALVCASPESTAAIELQIPNELLITGDWRLPGAEAPLDWAGLKVWPVDPHKYLDTVGFNDIYKLIEQIKPWFSLVVVDCGGSLSLCSRVARNEGILLLRKEGDAADLAASAWLKKYGGDNIMVMAPSERPDIIAGENGFVISRKDLTRASGKYD